MDIFRTIAYPSEAVFTEKRSKFLAFAFPVKTIEEIKAHIATISKEYFDARHVCYAYMLGHERNTFRTNDNGEPSGTAGKPILGQINSFELTDILIVVVRYFGGIKLGTSGLIVSYRQAAREVIEAAEIIEKHATEEIVFTFPYEIMNDVMKLTRFPGVEIISSAYDNICTIKLQVELDRKDGIENQLRNINNVNIINS